mmetsp:Transcript_21714/g.36962  ORF Transcript_21714/g.36962 Transcript_21714/m.36962 type:complete len:104 (-) Transcript_21714:456-767(-)
MILILLFWWDAWLNQRNGWSPELGPCCARLIQERGIPLANDDPCLQALQHVWLGNHVVASATLSMTFGPETPFGNAKSNTVWSTDEDSVAAMSQAVFPRGPSC